MIKQITRKFDWLDDDEVDPFIRETFAAIQMGRGYHGRIVVKNKLFGYNKEDRPVSSFTNRGEILYTVSFPCKTIVTSIQPEMNCVF